MYIYKGKCRNERRINEKGVIRGNEEMSKWCNTNEMMIRKWKKVKRMHKMISKWERSNKKWWRNEQMMWYEWDDDNEMKESKKNAQNDQ